MNPKFVVRLYNFLLGAACTITLLLRSENPFLFKKFFYFITENPFLFKKFFYFITENPFLF